MKMRNMSKNALAVAVGAGLAAMPALSAQAYEFSISGHINRSIIQLDNGDQDSVIHTFGACCVNRAMGRDALKWRRLSGRAVDQTFAVGWISSWSLTINRYRGCCKKTTKISVCINRITRNVA